MMWLYRSLLLLLPPSFRRAHGHEWLQVARTALSRDSASHAALTSDLLRSILREWHDAFRTMAERLRVPRVSSLTRDVRYAGRSLVKSPGSTIAAVITPPSVLARIPRCWRSPIQHCSGRLTSHIRNAW